MYLLTTKMHVRARLYWYHTITYSHKGTLCSETVPKAHFSDHKMWDYISYSDAHDLRQTVLKLTPNQFPLIMCERKL